MALLDPSETWASKILRWTFWTAVAIGAILYGLANPESIWGGLQFGALALCVGLILKGLIVDPIIGEIRALRAELRLGQRREYKD